MSQSQVYLFLYERFDIWKWITGHKRSFHAGINLYGKEFCYTKEGIVASTHALDFEGALLKRTFTLATTDVSETNFLNKINTLKEGQFSALKYDQMKNNSCHFATALIMFLLEIDHLEPELEEYLNPSIRYDCNLM